MKMQISKWGPLRLLIPLGFEQKAWFSFNLADDDSSSFIFQHCHYTLVEIDRIDSQ